MKKILLILGVISLGVSITWAFTKKDGLEPWTAVIGSLSMIASLFVKSDNETEIEQQDVLSGGNESSVKNFKGKAKQFNFLGFKNVKKIEGNGEED